jgi:hypothetical protein
MCVLLTAVLTVKNGRVPPSKKHSACKSNPRRSVLMWFFFLLVSPEPPTPPAPTLVGAEAQHCPSMGSLLSSMISVVLDQGEGVVHSLNSCLLEYVQSRKGGVVWGLQHATSVEQCMLVNERCKCSQRATPKGKAVHNWHLTSVRRMAAKNSIAVAEHSRSLRCIQHIPESTCTSSRECRRLMPPNHLSLLPHIFCQQSFLTCVSPGI